MSESQLHSDVHAATGPVEGSAEEEAADMIDEASGSADEPGDDEVAAGEDDAAEQEQLDPRSPVIRATRTSVAGC